ncbi:hypothetical protein [Allorhizocola rhizosphaerae]|uniref:hypothetical protein n=1 Tax=Allorhizocola rhizosphaerae TaxID=1872709 RepID=UPI000E3D6F32|nr:hypothetical protein [Allorhizocola rhizosphaerae]
MASLRPLFAWALLGYVAIDVFFTLARWLEPFRGSGFVQRAHSADFTTFVTVGFPILAVLIAAHLQPVLGQAKVIAAVALGEYATIIGLGALSFVVGLPHLARVDSAVSILAYVIYGFAGLAFAALAAFGVVRSFLSVGGGLTVKLDG